MLRFLCRNVKCSAVTPYDYKRREDRRTEFAAAGYNVFSIGKTGAVVGLDSMGWDQRSRSLSSAKLRGHRSL